MEAAGLTNAKAELFLAASEAALIGLHEQMQTDTTLASIALDLSRVERGLALLVREERAAAAAAEAESAPNGGSGRLMDPRSAMAYMDDVTRRAEAAAAPPPPPPVADSRVEGRAEPVGPSSAEHAAALVTRELLSNPAFLQSVLASGIAAAQAAAAAQNEAETQPEMEDAEEESVVDAADEVAEASPDEVDANPEDAPLSLLPTPPPPPMIRQEPRAVTRDRPMDIEDIMASAESVAEDEIPEDLNGNHSLTLNGERASPIDNDNEDKPDSTIAID